MAGAEVPRLTGYTVPQISRIQRRFAEEGLAELLDRPRSGRPPLLTEAKRARIVTLTLKAPPKGLTHWSTREIAERVRVSLATVHRIWQAHAPQPHQVETVKFTTDPQAETKIRDEVGPYLISPTNAVVLSVDEKTQIRALERTQLLPLRPNFPARRTHDYHRHGLTSRYAALEVGSGRVLGECSERHTVADFLCFLKGVNWRYRGRELHAILDNSSTHATPSSVLGSRSTPTCASTSLRLGPLGSTWPRRGSAS